MISINHKCLWVCDKQGHRDGYSNSVSCLVCDRLYRDGLLPCAGVDHKDADIQVAMSQVRKWLAS